MTETKKKHDGTVVAKKFGEFINSLVEGKENNEKTPAELKKITNKIIQGFRDIAMKENDMKASSFLMLTDIGNVNQTGIPLQIVHSKLGEMTVKSTIRKVNKEKIHGNVDSFIEIAFARGMMEKSDTLEDAKAKMEKFTSMSREELDSYMSNYMIATVYSKKNIEMSMFDIIRSTDKSGRENDDYFVVAPKAMRKEVIKYDNVEQGTNEFFNYFD